MKYKSGDKLAPKNSGLANKTIMSYNSYLEVYVLQAEGIKNPSSLTEDHLDENYELIERIR